MIPTAAPQGQPRVCSLITAGSIAALSPVPIIAIVLMLATPRAPHAMKATLAAHPHFKDFLIHVAAGSGAKMGAEAKKPVNKMLAKAA
jgi:hypothetical protein